MREAVSLMGDTETKCDYVEQAFVGLKSVTHYGLQGHKIKRQPKLALQPTAENAAA